MHTIRLRRPWQRTRDGEAVPTRVDVPDVDEPLDLPDPWNSVTYTRDFNRPTGLDDNSRVQLRIQSWTGSVKAILLNDELLEIGNPPFEIEITERVQRHNQILICIERWGQPAARLSGAVDLLID